MNEKMKLVFLLVFSCCLLDPLLAQEHGEGGEEGASIVVPPCAISRERLDRVVISLFPESYEITTNCLSFNEDGLLSRGIVSGVSATSEDGMRLVLRCVEGVIVSEQSSLNTSSMAMAGTACLNCSDTDVDAGICVNVCSPPCERCYDRANRCTRCLACTASRPEQCSGSDVSSVCASSCPAERGTVTFPDLYNHCNCPSGYYRELRRFPEAEEPEIEDIPEECEDNPDLEDFQCVRKCSGGREFNEELNHCFACALEYCVRCNNDTRECDICLEHTVEFEHECFACPQATIARYALLQEEELEEEERDQLDRQIELAVSLPVLSVLIVLFFVGMSLFAHKRYPHINPKGHKRHRTKQESEFDDPADETAPPISADVWRARPTVRLR